MANVVITVSGNSLIVDYGDYSSSGAVDALSASYCACDIVEIQRAKDDSHCLVMMRDAHGKRQWEVTYDATYSGDEYFIIDSIDTVAPTSNSDLFNKLTALRG